MSDPWAIARYQAIAAYIAVPPDRGRRRALLEQLALVQGRPPGARARPSPVHPEVRAPDPRLLRQRGHLPLRAHATHVACLGIAGITFTQVRRPPALNEAWFAWCDDVYNLDDHGETGEAPGDRWRKGLPSVRFVSEAPLQQAFLWRERRTPDKSGVFSLFGTEYQVGAARARRDAGVLGVDTPRPHGDWLGHLIDERRRNNFIEPTPQMLAEAEPRRRAEADTAVFDVLAAHLDRLLADHPRDLHVQVYLELLHPLLKDTKP